MSHGPATYAVPGPSMVPQRVLRAMQHSAVNIYEGPLIEMTASVQKRLAQLANCAHAPFIYLGNGHAGWEAAIANIAREDATLLVLCTGRFAQGWAEMAEKLGITVEIIDFGTSAAVDPAQLETRLRRDNGKIAAVMLVQTDTASSVHNDIPAVRAAMDAAEHDALLMVDCIASFGCEKFDMQGWGIDVMVAASQKGLMTPPGITMNFVSDKALAARRALPRVSHYWDWLNRLDPEIFYMNFCGTAPTHQLLGLDEALTMIFEEGMEAVWARHRWIASAVWAAVSAWKPQLVCNVRDTSARSSAVTTLLLEGQGRTAELRHWAETIGGVTLGVAIPMPHPLAASHEMFRIGHMGHVNPSMMLGTLGTIEAALCALKIPHGSGALDAAARVFAAGPQPIG